MTKRPDGIATFCKVCNKPIHLWYNDWDNGEHREQLEARLCKEHLKGGAVGWISVKERLPEPNQKALGIVDGGYIYPVYWDDGWFVENINPFWYSVHIANDLEITHWIPRFPEGYSEKGEYQGC